MDFILELLFELFVEGTLELSKNIKVPKTIRYPLLGLIILFVIAVFMFFLPLYLSHRGLIPSAGRTILSTVSLYLSHRGLILYCFI